MADIQLIIAADVKEVNRAIDSVNKLERQARQAGKAFSAGKISQDKYNQSLLETTRAYTKYTTSRQKASADVRKFAREEIALHQQVAKAAEQKEWFAAQRRKLAMMKESERMAQRQVAEEQRQAQQSVKATQQQEAALERLKLQYNQTYAAASSFKKQLGDLNTLHRAGGISSEQHRLKVEALKEEYRAFLNGSATQMNQFVQGQNLMTKGANRSGMAVQQMGYQVGDFLVQVQSGTNWMVAFGQQATQLVGVLPMVAGSFGLTTAAAIGLSTVLGIGIPLVTALGAAWLRTRDANKEAAESVDLLESKIKSLDSTIQEFILTRRAAEAGISVDELLGIESLEDAEENLIKVREELQRLNEARSAANMTGGLGGSQMFMGAMFMGQNRDIEEAIAAVADAEERLANIRRMQSADRMSFVAEERQSLQDQLKINQLILQYGEDSVEVARERVAQERRLYEEALRNEGVGERTLQSLLSVFDQIKETAEATNPLFDAAQESFAERVKTLEHENNLLRIRREYGEGSVREQDYLLRTKEQELIALREAGLLTQEQLEAEMKLVREQQLLNDQLEAAELRSNALADALERAASAMSSLTSFGDSIDKQLQVAVAQVEALRAGQDAAIAGQITGLMADLEERRQAAIAADPENALLINAQAAVSRSQIEELERQRTVAAGLREEQRSSGGSSTSSEQEAYLDRLLREAEYKRSLVGLSDEEARIQEILFELKEQGQEVDMQRIQQIIETERATQELIAAEQERKSQLNQMVSDFQSMFESIINGSKSAAEAMRETFRKVLLDIYKDQVISPMADTVSGFIKGLFPQANGGAWSNGVQMFANGGTFTNSVVSKPTAFSHSSGLGVMGEAGPEAIMPLKRMPNGKLGVESNSSGGSSSSSVVVHQSFSFAANGDESVKKIIAEAAPAIASMTKKSLMEDRRRGGQTKATFR